MHNIGGGEGRRTPGPPTNTGPCLAAESNSKASPPVFASILTLDRAYTSHNNLSRFCNSDNGKGCIHYPRSFGGAYRTSLASCIKKKRSEWCRADDHRHYRRVRCKFCCSFFSPPAALNHHAAGEQNEQGNVSRESEGPRRITKESPWGPGYRM